MNKREIYDTLANDGATLRSFNTMKVPELEKIYTERFGKSPHDDDDTGAGNKNPSELPPRLFFKSSGWCNEIQKSYYRGTYQPKSQEEYEALKPFATEE